MYKSSSGVISLLTTGTANHVPYIPNGDNGRNYTPDGTHVYFETTEQVVPQDTDSTIDVYEASGGVVTLISGGTFDEDVQFRGSSDDGTKVVFHTSEGLVPSDTDGARDVYQASGGAFTLLSPPAISGFDWGVTTSGMTGDGSRVFLNTGERLVPEDVNNNNGDVYEASGGGSTLLTGGTASVDAPFPRGYSDDGSKFFFLTQASLVAGDTDTALDLYMSSWGSALASLGRYGELSHPDVARERHQRRDLDLLRWKPRVLHIARTARTEQYR